jgi:hypothetical protein
VVFAKWNPDETIQSDLELGGTFELAGAWGGVLRHWDQESKHNAFVAACAEQSRLPFAARKYGQILSVNPDDDRARAMRNRIVRLVSAGAEPRSRTFAKIPLPRTTSLVMLIASICFFMGVFAPGLRSLATLGACAFLVSCGLRVWMRGTR